MYPTRLGLAWLLLTLWGLVFLGLAPPAHAETTLATQGLHAPVSLSGKASLRRDPAGTPRATGVAAVELSPQLWREEDFKPKTQWDYLLIGLMLGAAGIMLCLNLALFVWLREKSYLYYVVMIAAFSLYLLVIQGYASQWFLPDNPDLSARLARAIICLHSVVATLFFSALFDFRRHSLWSWRFFRAVAGYNLVLMLVALAGYPVQTIAPHFIVALVSTLFGCGFALSLLVRGHREYWLPVIAFIPLYAIGIVRLLAALSVDDLGQSLGLSIYVPLAVMTHLLLLNIAIARRTRQAEIKLRHERRHRLYLARSHEQQLEHQVAQRTIELSAVHQQLHSEIRQSAEAKVRLRSALKKKQESLAAQRHFVSLVSHEFRTPLAVIDAATQSLSLSPVGKLLPVSQRTARIRHSVSHLTTLIENCLAEDRLSMETLTLRLENLDLRDLLRDACKSPLPAGTQRLTVHMPDTPIPLSGDRVLLGVALGNLLQNALKYSPEDQPVHVYLQTNGEPSATIDVADHGPGIEETERTRIFERNYRAANVQSIRGVGLGLYLAREIARKHNGNVILVDSSAGGSTFRLQLPLAIAVPGGLAPRRSGDGCEAVS